MTQSLQVDYNAVTAGYNQRMQGSYLAGVTEARLRFVTGWVFQRGCCSKRINLPQRFSAPATQRGVNFIGPLRRNGCVGPD